MVLNVPNGAGPGTFRFGSVDSFCTWTLTTNRNLVQRPQVTKTGRSNCYDLWAEDGGVALCTVNAISQDHFDDLGINDGGNPEPIVWCEWYPAESEIDAMRSVNVESGPTSPPWNVLTLAPGATSTEFSAPGHCRYAAVNSASDVTVRGWQVTQGLGQSTPLSISTASTRHAFAVGSWTSFTLRSVAGGDFSIVWCRYPNGV